MAGYYAAITHVDNQVGRLINALKRDGSLEDTVVIFLSDHGEMLFDHASFRKLLPYEGAAHIPVILRVGKHVRTTSAHRCSSTVELMDVMPTLLDLAGVPIPRGIDGRSFAGCVDGKPLERPYVHGEHAFTEEQSHHYIVTDSDKYIWFSQTGVERYFDLAHDPFETHDAIDDPSCQERINHLRNILIRELEPREEGFVKNGRLVVGATLKNVLEYPLD